MFVLSMVALTSCSHKTPSSKSNSCATSACDATGDCAGGQACIDGCCADVCLTSTDCDLGSCCNDGACGVCPDQVLAPVITGVDGTGSVDGLTDHTARHLEDRLVITGEHLLAASISLNGVGTGGDAVTLVQCEPPTDTQVIVQLPGTIVAGEYQLTATNQAGTCGTVLQLLQGEPGSLDASATQIITSINTAVAADPTLGVHGALYGGAVSTLSAFSSVTVASGRSIELNGSELTGGETGAGFYVMTLDLATHTVVRDPVGNFFNTTGLYPSNSVDSTTALVALVAQLTSDQVVVIVSGGDVTPLSGDAGVVTALASLGASQRVGQLLSSDAYVLIGSKGLGEANGLEMVGDATRGSVASEATVVVDQAVVGFTTGHAQATLDARYVNPGEADVITSAMIQDGSVSLADLAANGCTANQVMKRDGTNTGWVCASDIDTNTTYSAGTGITLTGTSFSSTLGTSIESAEITDGTITSADIANNTVASADILDGTIAFADIAANSCAANQVMKRNAANTAWACASDVDTNTTYSAGSGIVLTGTSFSSSLGTSIESAEITDGTITSADILDGAVTSADIANNTITSADILDGTIAFADIAANSCTAGQTLVRNAANNGWMCADPVGIKIGSDSTKDVGGYPGYRLSASRYRAKGTGVVTTLGVLPALVTAGKHIVMAIYSDNNNYPGTLLAQTGAYAFVATDADSPVHIPLQAPVQVTRNTVYWLAFMVEDTTPYLFAKVNRVGTFAKGFTTGYTTTMPQPFPAGAAGDWWWTLWAL